MSPKQGYNNRDNVGEMMNDKEFFKSIEDCIGKCWYCDYCGEDGDYGEIRCCDCEELVDDLDCDGLGVDVRCPFWKGNILRCEKHKKLSLNDLLCNECYEESYNNNRKREEAGK